jgi:hypothetical protein
MLARHRFRTRTRTAIAQAIAAWSPSTLFASGEQGAWYDPSDLTTLYQDFAGTTPVTAVEQPVGLMLDKSKGLIIGSELVANGSFAGNSSAGWILDTGWAVTNETLAFSGANARNATYYNADIIADRKSVV